MTASSMHLVDSSGWIEYFTESPNADHFAPIIEDAEHLLVASLALCEVYRWILREKGEAAALDAAVLMQQSQVVDLDATLAIRAAHAGLKHRLPLGDSVIYATARVNGATLWTQDADFEGIKGVRYIPKHRGP